MRGHNMRRLTFGIAVIAAVLAVASAAVAVPQDFCDRNPDHAKCQDTPPTTTTTTTTVSPSPLLDACEDTVNATLVEDGLIELTIPGSAQTSFECLWTPSQAAGTTTATVAVTEIGGAVRGLPTVFVRDDSPGDICLGTSVDGFEWTVEDGPVYSATFDLAYGTDLPDGYQAWEGTTYWDFQYSQDDAEGTHWCAPQDPVLDSLRTDTNGKPLHFMANFNARSGGHIVVELTP